MGMKVYVHYEEGGDAELHVTLKLTLPKKWNDESPVKLLKVNSICHEKTQRPAQLCVSRRVGTPTCSTNNGGSAHREERAQQYEHAAVTSMIEIPRAFKC